MKITFEGWEDRQPVRGTLQGLDRAQTQAADQITVHLGSVSSSDNAGAANSSTGANNSNSSSSSRGEVTIKQNPTALKGSKVRVGAAVWDGAYVLAAYLDAQPPGTFAGLRCVELGCGCGLVGLVLARLGAAAVYLTDKPQFLVGPRVNAARNKLLAPQAAPAAAATQAAVASGSAAAAVAAPTAASAGPRQQPDPNSSAGAQSPSTPQQQEQQQQQQRQQGSGPMNSSPPAVVQVVGLDWEDLPALQQSVAAILPQGPIDLIVASDCIYPDPDGSCPSSSGFMAAVTALATPGRTRVLTTFEARSDDLRQALLAAAAALPGGCEVVRVAQEQLPEGVRAEHVEVYELLLQQQPQQQQQPQEQQQQQQLSG